MSAQKAPSPLWAAAELDAKALPTHRASDAIGLQLQPEAFRHWRQSPPDRTSLTLPFPEGKVTLKLQRFDVRSEAFSVATTDEHGFKEVDAQPRILTYEAMGDVTGTVVLFKDHVVASLRKGGRRWEINRRSGHLHALFPVDASNDSRTFTCGVEEQAELPAIDHHRPPSTRSSALLECVEVGLEVDHYSYQSLGSNLDDAVDWALAILSAVDQIYRTELSELVTLDARFLHVWGSPDPYAGVVNNGAGLLGAFNAEWNNNPNFNAIPLDLKHLFTIRTNIGTGGIAYLSGLCNSFNAGVSGNLTTSTTYDLNTYAWNLDVVAHEIGHNCGANHTHWCGWPGGPIDNCGSLEGECDGYSDNPTGQLGTIMSYCHAIAGGSKNLVFHPLVRDNALIPTFNSASCIGSCGTPEVASTNLQCADANACNFNPGDVNNEGCVYAGDCAECAPDGGVTGGMEINNLSYVLSGTQSSTTSFEGSGTAQAMAVAMDFNNPLSGGSWPGDAVVVLCSPSGNCLQVGGYNFDPGFPSVGAWPAEWNVSAAGTYSANVDLGSIPLSGDGDWSIQVFNGWTGSGEVEYTLDIQIPGLCPSAAVVPGCTDPSACNFDPDANEDNGTCLEDDALGICGGDCSVDANNNGICDNLEACGSAACGAGTWWNAAAGLCWSNLLNCPGDLDDSGSVNVTDVLVVLSAFGASCGVPANPNATCPEAPCCQDDACGTGTVWDAGLQQCISSLYICPGDVDFDGTATVNDVLEVLSTFGGLCD